VRVAGAVLLAAPVLVLATALARHWAPPAAARFTLPVFVACWGMLFLGRLLACWWMARSTQRRAEAAGLERTVTLDVEGVELKTMNGSARIPWGAFATFRETPKAFLLQVDAARVLILPKRVLPGQQAAADVRGMIAASIARARAR
jgi:hypothetical protein